jgi:hypothetical protein
MAVTGYLEEIRRPRRVSTLLKVRQLGFWPEGGGNKKMLKMQDDPTISMKTQGRSTNCPARNPRFCMKFSRKRAQNGPNRSPRGLRASCLLAQWRTTRALNPRDTCLIRPASETLLLRRGGLRLIGQVARAPKRCELRFGPGAGILGRRRTYPKSAARKGGPDRIRRVQTSSLRVSRVRMATIPR